MEQQERQEDEEEQQEPQGEDAPDAPEEEIGSFRPGDTVMTIRKRIREARKARLLEEQRSRSPSPMLHSRMMPFVHQDSKVMAELEARETSKDAGSSSGRPPRKVERFHKDLIRKEVWRQKFNYLFKKMQAGVDLELVHDRKNRRLSIQQQRGLLEEDAEARRQRVVAGIQESVERELSKLRRASGPLGSPRPIARLSNQVKPPETVERVSELLETETEATEEDKIAICDFEPVSQPSQPPKPMGWRRTGPSRPKAPLVAQLPLQITREVPKKGGAEPGRRKRGIAGLLQPSASLPTLRTTPDLLGVREEYYGGDELFMHEDILHTSNPRLFPLRGGHSRPFPTVKLSLPEFDLE